MGGFLALAVGAALWRWYSLGEAFDWKRFGRNAWIGVPLLGVVIWAAATENELAIRVMAVAVAGVVLVLLIQRIK